MFGVPGLLAAIIIATGLFGAAAGVLWLLVFGDNPWPETANKMLVVLFGLTCVAAWITLLALAYIAGRNQETRAVLNVRHVLISAGATLMLVVLVIAHQWGVGNIGAPGNGVLCAEFCRDRGYAGSGMPPRNSGTETCSCFDARGPSAT